MARERKNDIQFDLTLNDEQKEAKAQILRHPINFLLGNEGSGKTLLATQIGLDGFFTNRYSQIVITRPAVAAESLGFLPGGAAEKLEPYLMGIYENLFKLYGGTESKKNKLKKHLENQEIKIIPIAFTRSITYDNAIVIVDEMQNLTRMQFEMILGRLGKTSKLIFTGSKVQIDLPRPSDSAIHLVSKLENNPYVSITQLKSNHRHEAVESVLNTLRGTND